MNSCANGWRLACQHLAKIDIQLHVPSASICTDGKLDVLGTEHHLRPSISYDDIHLAKAEGAAVIDEISRDQKREIWPRRALANLATTMASGESCIRIVRHHSRVLRGTSASQSSRLLGLAIDIGTTTLGAYLLDLQSGEILSRQSSVNPQGQEGSDIMSRIWHVQKHGNRSLEWMRETVIRAVNALIRDISRESETVSTDILHAIIVGNPTMLHLFLGINPLSIGHAPYSPIWRQALQFSGHEVGLCIDIDAVVETLPIVAGHVGADAVAGTLATKIHQAKKPEVLLDLGTNGEIVLGSKDGLICCSTAAGPALEGEGISCGMPAMTGAISEMSRDEASQVVVLGGGTPRGLCGSGLLDALAFLLNRGLMATNGRLIRSSLSNRLVEYDEEIGVRLTGPPQEIVLRQSDIRKLQLALAALRAGLDMLVDEYGIALKTIERVHVAGAFGSRVNASTLVSTGVVPNELSGKIVNAGNAAGTGALRALADREALCECQRIADQMRHIDLSLSKEFNGRFVNRMRFPTVCGHTNREQRKLETK